MNEASNEEQAGTIGRRMAIGGAALAVGSATLLASTGSASAGSNRFKAEDELAIRQLSINYALGTDSVSAGNMPAALEYYGRTFTSDAKISAGFVRETPLLSAVGPVAWSELVKGAFTNYSATQHHLGTINVVFPERRGEPVSMTSYLIATHVFRNTLQLSTVLGTYIDVVENIRRVGWRITERFLQLTSSALSERVAPAPAPT